MVSSVSNSASAYASAYTSNRPPPRPSASEMAGNLFSQLDTKKQGYIEKSDLQAAFDNISGGTGASASVDDVFSSIDSDSDGKVTKDELTTSLQNLADQLDAQFDSSRMAGAMGGMPPGPPPGPPPGGGGGGAGFSKDELQSQLDEIGSTDSKRSSLISKVVENFDEADSDGDGKVSFQEAMAYDQANPSSSSSSASSTSTAAASSSSTEETVYQRILELLQAYAPNRGASEAAASSISVTA